MEISHTSFLKPVFEGCQSSGIDYHRLARQTDLKYFDYASDQSYITMDAANGFLSHIEKQQSIDNLAMEFSQYTKASALKGFRDLVLTSPSILDFLTQCEKMSTAVFSNETLKLRVEGNKAIFYDYFANLDPVEYDLIMQINFVFLLDTFDFITHQGWQPDEIHCQSNFTPKVLDLFPQFSNTKILLDQPMTAIVFDTVELAHSYQQPSASTDSVDGTCIGGLRQRVEFLIDSYALDWGAPNIVTVARLLGTSERTLRRKLAQEACSFGEILSSWRIRKSLQLLQIPSVSVNEIASRLHYRRPNNFTRSFKKVFGNAPIEFRDSVS